MVGYHNRRTRNDHKAALSIRNLYTALRHVISLRLPQPQPNHTRTHTHWKPKVVMMATLSSLMSPQAVITTTCSAINDDKVMTTLCFTCADQLHNYIKNNIIIFTDILESGICILVIKSQDWNILNTNHCPITDLTYQWHKSSCTYPVSVILNSTPENISA